MKSFSFIPVSSFRFGEGEPEVKPPEEKPEDKKEGKTYTEDEFNRHMAGARRKHEAELKKQATDLEKLSKDVRLSQEERDSYASRLEDVEKQYKTAEQLADERVKKINEETKQRVEALSKEKEQYKMEYENLRIDQELVQESALAEELIPGQLKKLLRADTTLVDELDEETKKPTGRKVVRVNFDDEKDGKAIKLVLPVKETLKRMKELPDRFGNFFKGSGRGGIGGSNGLGGGTPGTMPKGTEAYIAQRNAGKK